jgi:ComF family protein
MEKGNFCEQCRELKFDFRKNRSLGVFRGNLRILIHLYKFKGRRSLFRVFSHLSVTHMASYILSHDMIVPVPLSNRRYTQRGFNQSFLIGRDIAKKMPIPFSGDIMKRSGRARPQSSIESLHIRRINMTDNFEIAQRYRKLVSGKDMLLIDDVLTTGATASACARTLYYSGAGNVDLFSMARSIKSSVYI